jgi:vancomycin resistance protein YoaR
MKKKLILIPLAVILVGLPLSTVLEKVILRNESLLRVSFEGDTVSKKDKTELKKLLEKKWAKQKKPTVSFEIDSRKEKAQIESLQPAYEKIIDRIIKSPRKLTFENTYLRYITGKDFKWELTFDSKQVKELSKTVANKYSVVVPIDAQIYFENDTYNVRNAQRGLGVSYRDLVKEIEASLVRNKSVNIPLKIAKIQPVTTTEIARKSAKLANSINDTPHIFKVLDKQVEMPPKTIGDSMFLNEDTSELDFNLELLKSKILPIVQQVETPVRNASFDLANPNEIKVIPSTQGKHVDFESIKQKLLKNAPLIEPKIITVDPTIKTDWAEKMKIHHQVSTFTTNFTGGQPRVKNIARGAELVDSHVVEPGQTFSLNKFLGKRTIEKGFVNAPIYDSEKGFVNDVGGGLSQYTTTLFNAAFFGGYKINEHSPHSIYISRYPMGREATINFGTIDLKFTNNTSSGILIKNTVTSNSITVTMYGDKEGKTVSAEGPIILSMTPVETEYEDTPSLPAGTTKLKDSKGLPGYSVVNYRIIDQPNKPQIKEKFAWSYSMHPTIYLRGTG